MYAYAAIAGVQPQQRRQNSPFYHARRKSSAKWVHDVRMHDVS